MSTLTDFDTVTNQNIIAGLGTVPNQFMVMDGSRLFGGNPSLPCPPTTPFGSVFAGNPSLPFPSAPCGSGQFGALLFDDTVHFTVAGTSVAGAAPMQTSLHSTVASFHHIVPSLHTIVPPVYSPSPSGNNNTRTTHDTTISSQNDEGCSMDDDEASSILSNLPNSCQDFERQEMHIRLERNHSSPLIGGHSSPALSSRLSSNCPSAEPPTDPAEPEDLEVQLINECFEEQQRQSQMYQSGDLKTLFYHGSSDLDSSKVSNRPGTDKSGQSSLERPERLPYAKKLSSHEPLSSASLYDSNPIAPSPAFLKQNENFEPLLTPKSEALVQNRVRRQQNASPNRRRVSEPLAQKPPLFWGSGLATEPAGFGSGELFESVDHFIEDKARHISFDNSFLDPVPPIVRSPTLDLARQDETEALAKGVIESLFIGVPSTPLSPAKVPKEDPRRVSGSKNKAVRKLYMDHLTECEPTEKPAKFGFDRLDPPLTVFLDTIGQSSSHSMPVEIAPVIHEGPIVLEDDDSDSWENLDDTKLEEQMTALKLEAATKTVVKRPINYFAPPIEAATPWDPFLLPHVLEAYDIPEYKVAEDVVNALAATDWGNATVRWLERKMVFVVFASERQARDALVLHKHQWLRLRPLSKSPARIQEKAREMQTLLKPARARPKTHAGVARRMVESTLGLRSAISKEQRDAERKQLSDAKAAKKNSVRWDD